MRALVETRTLVGERGGYHLVKAPETIQVPATVQAILAARIDRLPAEHKRLLQAASVVGKDVPFLLLQAIADLDERRAERRARPAPGRASSSTRRRCFPISSTPSSTP